MYNLNPERWTVNATYFTEVSKTSTSITLTAKNIIGYFDITYNLITGCNGNNNLKVKTVQILTNCAGTLNGGPLNTFNMVPTGPNQVVMGLGTTWTWVKTSGNASWSTSDFGQKMQFTISSGCSSFNAYNSNCNLTITFCKGSSFMVYSFTDMKTFKVIKEGKVEDVDEINSALKELPAGEYIINIDGNKTRLVKIN